MYSTVQQISALCNIVQYNNFFRHNVYIECKKNVKSGLGPDPPPKKKK